MDKYYCNIYPGYVFSCPSVGWSVGCWVGHFPKRAESKNRLFLDVSWINVLTCFEMGLELLPTQILAISVFALPKLKVESCSRRGTEVSEVGAGLLGRKRPWQITLSVLGRPTVRLLRHFAHSGNIAPWSTCLKHNIVLMERGKGDV